MPSRPTGEIAALRFLAGSGTRLALRVMVPLFAAAAGAGMLLGSDFLRSLARVLFGEGSGFASGVVCFLLLLGVARAAAPRVSRGLDGWVRHLPISGLSLRRVAVGAVMLATGPLLLAFAILALVAEGNRSLTMLFVGLLLAAWAAALASVPSVRGGWVRLLAVPAGLLAFRADLISLIAAAALAFLADRLAGPLERSGPRAPTFRFRRLPFAWRIAWRAIARRLPGTYLSGLLPLACGWAFVAHNPLSDRHQALGASLAGGLAAVLVLAGLAESLALLRPVWPWARSLPWSARDRVREDAILLGLHSLPMLLLAALIAPPTWALVAALSGQLALLPPLAVLAAAAIRRTPERRTGAAGEILFAGSLAVALTALVPWLALPALLATPWLIRRAALRDQRQSVSRWLEIHHLAVGDPQSWSA